MANVKNLFNNNPKKVLSSASLNDVGASIESADYVKRNFQEQDRFVPHVDFSSASNFAFYGSAEKYNADAFTYISNEYPYDGSLKEKIEWELSGTYFDKYIFDSIYPRTTGYINHGLNYGSLVNAGSNGFSEFSHEYIKFLGGPHTGSSNVTSNLTKNFTGSNVYRSSVNQESNIELDGEAGFAVEFWLKKDAWADMPSESRAQVILDIWNSSSATPGRLTIWADKASPNNLLLEVASGSTDTYISNLGSSLPIIGDTWNHYALNFENVGSDLQVQLYLNGNLNDTKTSASKAIQKVTGSFMGYIGALTKATEVGGWGGEAYAKLSASFDEFRYWKSKRTPPQIARSWFTQVAGGTNTDFSTLGTGSTKYSPGRPVDLGVYYKFNEGIFDSGSTNSKDAVVLDYSGRLSNGSWTGYAVGARNTGSAMIESSASATEFKDPILDLDNPFVSASLSDLRVEGQFYDSTNNASIFHTLPGWIREGDLENDGEVLYKLTQIIGSYFDTLQLQIQSIPRLKDQNYFSGSYKPYPFTNRLIENLGFEVGELFTEADALESLAARDDFIIFEQKLNEVKNRIYSNLYNNITGILKSKGTEKAFRNIIRCYGVDENLVRLNLYADQSEYILRANFDSSVIRKRYADFNAYNRVEATVYQSTSSVETANTRAYLSSSAEMKYRGNTFEAEVIFPQKISRDLDNYFANNFVESSIFGAHTVNPASPNDDQWHLPDASNFVVSSVRPSRGSESVYFKLSASSGFSSFPVLTSSLINDVYADTRWNLSVRIKPKAYPYASDVVTGSMGYKYDVIFSGYQPIVDSFNNSFTATGTLSNDAGVQFLTGSKKMFAGAHRTNFTGSTITKSDVKISSVRAWMDYLDDATIEFHAKDSANFGTKSPLKNAYMTPSGSGFFGKNVDKIPQLKTLAMNWDFETVTSSTAAGAFTVQDASSGSQADTLEYGWIGPISLYQHTGQGFGFPESSTGSISREFVQTAKQLPPEILNSSNMVSLVGSNDDSLFTRDSRPISFFFAAEKSMYRIVSEQILKIFATIVDFNNLIGEPVNRYRPEYKQLEKLRNAYFNSVENDTIDFEKFVDYYKWIDQSITVALLQIFPASADYSNKVWTMIESHILERNKYWTKFPLVKKFPSTEGSARGINELSYNWEFGHAPIPATTTASNCVWWKDRTDRTETNITSGDSYVDSQRDTFRSLNATTPFSTASISQSNVFPTLFKPDGTAYYGDVYGIRNLAQVYKFKIQESDEFKGGTNVPRIKNLQFAHTELQFGSSTRLQISASSIENVDTCNDVVDPNEKNRLSYKLINNPTSYKEGKGEIFAPFSLFSSSVTTGYVADLASNFKTNTNLVNYHNDVYGDDNEAPLQGPFTEKYVGGREYRHVRFPTTSSDIRPEAWNLDFNSSVLELSPRTIHQPRSTILREPLARRPVNIRNIRITTGSASLGNYERSYELVQTNGRTINNRFFVKAGGFFPTSSASPYLANTVEYALPRFDLTGSNQYIIVNRFNAPGGVDVSSRGVLDYIAEEYAIYNDLNFRNLTVREALQEWQTEYCGQFGIKPPNTANPLNYDTPASYQKVNRNTRILAATTTTTGTLRDNWFVQHAIPQSAYQYSWITASVNKTITNIEQMAYGFVSNATIPSGTTSMTQSALPFILVSDSGSGPVLSDFVGLNTLIYDPLNSSERILSASNSVYRNDFLTGGLKQAGVLNALLLHRNGPYQNPSWKQIRGYENPIVRYQRTNNILSMREQPSDSLYVDSKLGRRIDPGVSGTVVKFMPPFRSKTNKTTTTLWVTASLTEPPVSFKYKPLMTVLRSNDATQNCDFTYLAHSYGNNIGTFANNTFIDLLGIDEDLIENQQNYHKIRKLYENNASAVLKKFTYGEVVYPRDVNTGLNKIRMRTNYAEVTNSVGSNGLNRSILNRRTFWAGTRAERIRSSSIVLDADGEIIGTQPQNSLGFVDAGANNVWPLDNLALGPAGGASAIDFPSGSWSAELIRYTALNDQFVDGNDPILFPSASVITPLFYTGSTLSPAFFATSFYPTASQVYHVASKGAPTAELPPQWSTNYLAGVNPWFDSYEDYANDIKAMAKEFTIIPEFKISDQINYFVNEMAGDFRSIKNNLLTLDGASITASATSPTDSLNDEFFTTYSNSDFQKYFGTFSDDAALNKITLTCNGVKKLLPYNGFYPMLRCMQLGSILSQSVAENIGGINWSNGEAKTSDGVNALSGALAVQSLVQPFFAPGIIYNTIKSGIAVDWPVFTGSLNISQSTQSLFYGSITRDAPNYRIPFEALVSFADHIPISSSSGEGKISLLSTDAGGFGADQGAYERLPYFDWNGKIKPTFEMATNNFLAEVPNFFLKDNSFTAITSKPENEFKTFKSGSSYYMDVYLEMPNSGTSRTVMFEGYYSVGNGTNRSSVAEYPYSGSNINPSISSSIFPYEYRGRWFGPTYSITGSQQFSKYNILMDPAQAPNTPPYYYGKSKATLKYVADGTETGAGLLEKILSNSTIEFSNPQLEARFTLNGDFRHKPAYTAAMMLSSSLNLLGKTRLKQIEYDLNQNKGVQFVPSIAKDPSDSSFDAWVISPKFETPILDFSNQPNIAPDTGPTAPRGMWSGYGEFCTGSKGLILGIEETYPTLPQGSGENTTGLTGSLLKQCGFDSAKKREKVGEIAGKKTISEAIVAIPYLEGSITNNPFAKTIGSPILQKWLFTLSGKTKKQSRKLYDQTKLNVQNGVEPLTKLPFKTTDAITETSISDLTEKMGNYVIPPQLNFDLYSDIEPFVMYFMEFEHELDRQDLADIWQGVMPKISRIAEKDTSTVEHQVAPWEFFGGQKLPEGIKWMVFKVKKKAAINYFAATADSSDDDRFKFNFKNNKNAVPDYSYNWPYDYFSLVELAQIEVEDEFKTVRDVPDEDCEE